MTETYNQAVPSRVSDVLLGLIEEYIRTAHPVGSSQLVEALELDLSPATVRNIFRVLEEEDFVFQPHTSAGRVPTDRGYRYYVDNYAHARLNRLQQKKLASLVAAYEQQFASPAQIVAKVLADMTGTLAVSGWLRTGDVRQAGLAALARQFPDTAMQEVLELVDNVDQVLEKFSEYETPETQVYIGEENPVVPTKYTSIVLRTIHADGEEVTLMLVGPKRMPYRRNVAWLSDVASFVEDWDYDV